MEMQKKREVLLKRVLMAAVVFGTVLLLSILCSNVSAQAVSMGKTQAAAKAKSYLRISAFSEKGLIAQLEYEGFSKSEAKYGVKHCGANWNQQALLKAKSYLKISSFSKQSLIRQLEYDGFTSAQARYAAKKVGY